MLSNIEFWGSLCFDINNGFYDVFSFVSKNSLFFFLILFLPMSVSLLDSKF